MVAAAFRVGLRVADVEEAARFYRGFGFGEVGTMPDAQGRPVMTILDRGDVHLIVDALVGMPFADSERDRQIQAGPRGLGVAIGLGVDDLDASYEYCRTSGCTVTSEPMDEAWGDRVFECIDPFGYVWEFSQPIADGQPDDGFAAVQEKWFGTK